MVMIHSPYQARNLARRPRGLLRLLHCCTHACGQLPVRWGQVEGLGLGGPLQHTRQILLAPTHHIPKESAASQKSCDS